MEPASNDTFHGEEKHHVLMQRLDRYKVSRSSDQKKNVGDDGEQDETSCVEPPTYSIQGNNQHTSEGASTDPVNTANIMPSKSLDNTADELVGNVLRKISSDGGIHVVTNVHGNITAKMANPPETIAATTDILPEGTTIVNPTEGTTTEIPHEGTTFENPTEGTTESPPEGTTIENPTEGTTTESPPEGTTENPTTTESHPAGTIIKNPTEGTTTESPPEGTIENPTDIDGTTTESPPEGTTIENPTEGTTTESPEGTTTENPTEGTTTESHPAGTNRVSGTTTLLCLV